MMYEKLKGKVHFQIRNGDWLYEEKQDLPVEKWQKKNEVPDGSIPWTVEIAPTIVGVWAVYKTYLSRAESLAKRHKNIPIFFVCDDHEMINDINGTNNPGYRHRKPVMVLNGDLHNNFVIKITDRVLEFASGSRNSGNHNLMDEANRHINGDYE